MKTIFDKSIRETIIERIQKLDENSKALWGKMNVYQVLRHCTLFEEMIMGKKIYKRAFIGRLLGKMALKDLLKDEKPMQRNAPTSPEFRIKETSGDVLAEKDKWISLVKEYEHFSNDSFVHWFFGKMTRERIGYFVYKHTDHHLRQFAV